MNLAIVHDTGKLCDTASGKNWMTERRMRNLYDYANDELDDTGTCELYDTAIE